MLEDLHLDMTQTDTATWALEAKGIFTVKSMYLFLNCRGEKVPLS